jgi:thiamine-monophosphate kinase
MIGKDDLMAPPTGELNAIAQILEADRSAANGDDAAIVEIPGGLACISTDIAVRGVHLAPQLTLWQSGYRAAACALSDLAAMAATPLHVVCAVTVPDGEWEQANQVVQGARERAEECGAQLVGGDLSSGPELSIAVTVVGTGAGRGTHGLISRAGAHRGDGIWVTGTLGAAAVGLDAVRRGAELPHNRYLDPPDRTRAARILAGYANAMMDISDGVATDIVHLCEASGVGAELQLNDFPLAVGIDRLDSPEPTQLAAGFGDDYELLFTVSPGRETEMAAALEQFDQHLPVTRIGMIDVPGEIRFLQGADTIEGLRGYEHG